jgi:hypothetical protein
MKIQHSYLMWVGAEQYDTIRDYVQEVRELGVSKRLPGIGMANALAEPGSIVFVAHDDGEAYSCDVCLGQVECSECRIGEQKIAKWKREAEAVRKRYANDDEVPRGKERIVEIREARIAKVREAMAQCELCGGDGKYECGTGGHVVRKDGSKMDYRAYNYWMRQPAKFDDSEIASRHMCAECSGTGKKPAAVVFGAFVPTIEVVVSGREIDVVKEKIADFDQVSLSKVAKEAERRPSKRRALELSKRQPGYYAVAGAGKASKRAQSVAMALTAARAVKGEIEVIGDVVLFSKPVKVDEKRFRGVKRFGLLPVEEIRAEMSA